MLANTLLVPYRVFFVALRMPYIHDVRRVAVIDS